MILHGSVDDLADIAATNELRRWSALPLHAPSLAQLDALLLHIYHQLRPKTIHYQQRRMLLDVFNKMASKIFGKAGGFPVVEEFGSFKMDLFTADSDLDLSVNFTDSTSSTLAEYPRAEKIKAIRKLSKTLYAHQKQGHVKGVMPIVGARVPVLKVTDCGTGIECDISIENKDGISRSTVISLVSSIDERFCILSYLMKLWAKANNINSSKDRTMSSMTIIALVAFHLQTRNPPILPPFLALLKETSQKGSESGGSRGKKKSKNSTPTSTSAKQQQQQLVASPAVPPFWAIPPAGYAAPGAASGTAADYWAAAAAAAAPTTPITMTVKAPTPRRSLVHADPKTQDEREVKRQKRKQSNRESARRSRLKKQAEWELVAKCAADLKQENESLKEELKRVQDECEKLNMENASLKEKINENGHDL